MFGKNHKIHLNIFAKLGFLWLCLLFCGCQENLVSNYFAPGFDQGDRPVEQTINNAPSYRPKFIAPNRPANFIAPAAPKNSSRNIPSNVNRPNSRYYSDPYAFPVPNQYQNFDADQYYTAPKNIMNREY